MGVPPVQALPLQQLAFVGDLSRYDPSRLDGFLDDVADVLGVNPQFDGRFIEAVRRQTVKAERNGERPGCRTPHVYPGTISDRG